MADLSVVLFSTQPEPQDPDAPKERFARPHATTNEEGKFTLATTGDDDGAPEGEYIVVVQYSPKVQFGILKKHNRGSPIDETTFGDHTKSPLRVQIKAVEQNDLGTLEIQ